MTDWCFLDKALTTYNYMQSPKQQLMFFPQLLFVVSSQTLEAVIFFSQKFIFLFHLHALFFVYSTYQTVCIIKVQRHYHPTGFLFHCHSSCCMRANVHTLC